jgi:redox-sensitive bicupin YhaK (pirin superfamily)
MQVRTVERIVEPVPVLEGAGVRLKRAIASHKLDYVDPFLLLDHFGSDDPQDYMAGFPMHPHRGIETVTYMLEGFVRHGDSLGNAGTIGAGDVQWMTAGSGILHEEMPQPDGTRMYGFQLWVNLPARLKMSQPRYQEYISERIPRVEQGGTTVRIIAGQVGDVMGPVGEIAIAPTYLDVEVAADRTWSHRVEAGHTAFAYVFEGQGTFGPEGAGREVEALGLALLSDGDRVEVRTGGRPVRFLFVSGQPLHEPVARYGPFVMNTRDEIQQALQDLRQGTFVKVQPETNTEDWYGSSMVDEEA